MKKDMIQEIWDRNKLPNKEISMRELEQAMRSSIYGQNFASKLFIWIWLFIIFATMVINGMNIAGYLMNPTMTIVQIGLTVVTMIFAVYGILLLIELNVIERATESVLKLLKRKLKFYRAKYEIWNFMMAAMIPILSFSVNTYIDNQNGIYQINKPIVFYGVSLIQFLFGYVIVKVAQYPVLKEIKVFLSDLESQATEGTQKLLEMKKRWRIWGIVFVIIAIMLLLFGIWQALKY